MGWAKYYEDNVSICIGRMAVKESLPVRHAPVRNYRVVEDKREAPIQSAVEHKVVRVITSFEESMGNGRRGLELFFVTSPEVRICRKLQMNGWWWSTAKKCWCNFNTKVNCRYAEETARRYQAQIIIVAA